MDKLQPVEGVLNDRESHFATAHLLPNLRHRAISNGLVTIFAQGIQFCLTLGSTAILARLLSPQDYGLIAMVATVVAFLRIFGEAGLTTATVQREGITDAQVSNLFWVNVLVAGVVTLLLAAGAPLIAWFYRQPEVAGITIWLSTTFLLTGLAAQHLALLQRQMRFVTVSRIQLTSTLISFVVGIAMARMGYGYWALVGIQISQALTSTVLIWSASCWIPRLPSRAPGTLSLVTFGAHLTLTTFIWSLARGADVLLLGRLYGSGPLGLYTRAAALLNRPMEHVLGPIHAVFVPVFSRIQNDHERYRRTFLQAFESVALCSYLLTGLFLALSQPLTVIVLGWRWEMASPIFAAFAPSAIFLPLASVTTWLLASQGRGKEFTVSSALGAATALASIAAGLPYGPIGVALAYSVSGLFLGLPILFSVAGRRGPVTTTDLWRATLRQLPVWGVVTGGTFFVRQFYGDAAPLMQVMICGLSGVAFGIVFIFIYPPSRRVAASMTDVIRSFVDRGDVNVPHQSSAI